MLREYHAIPVQGYSGLNYLVHFAQPLNERAVGAALKAASPYITSWQDEMSSGGADDITYQTVGSGKQYVFTLGGGDCAAGCILHHCWTFTIAADNSISLVESGDPLSQVTANNRGAG